MGGYIIARNSEEAKTSDFINPQRCARESCIASQLEPKEKNNARYTAIEGIGNTIDEPMARDDDACSRSDELARFKHLFPHKIQGPLRLMGDGSNMPTTTCPAFPVDISTNQRHQQMYPSRLIVAGRADRINKSRRISPNSVKDPTKAPGSPQRSELPKTPMSWSSEDDILLRDLKELKKLGWKEISAYFPKRTAHACQFRWRRLVSGTLKGHRQCPTQAPNGPSPQISTDRKDSESKVFFGAFEHPISNPCRKDLFDASSVESDSKQLVASLTMSSPSSPSDLLHSKLMRSPTLTSRSISLSPPVLRQTYYPRVDENEDNQTGWEGDDNQEVDHMEPRKASSAYDDSFYAHKPPHSNQQFSHDNANYAYHSPSSHRSVETSSWTSEEDSLLLNRRLSFDEVSILLHHRSEEAIWSRMGILRSSISKSVRIGCPSLTA